MYESFPRSTDADVIIIGAGLSGMSAAFYLLEHDSKLRILILEATNYIGGRTLSLPLKIRNGDQMSTYDLGGQFVSSYQAHIMDLIEKLDLKLVKTCNNDGKTVWILDRHKTIITSGNHFCFGNFHEALELTGFFNKLETMCKSVTLINPYKIKEYAKFDSITMETFVRKNLQSSISQNFVRHLIMNSCGMELSQMSVLYYVAFCNASGGVLNHIKSGEGSAKEAWIEGGAEQICQKIASIIGRQNIKRNDPVIEIKREPFHIIIETEEKTYHSHYVILAIPPTEVLNIEFYPPLTLNQCHLLNSIETGHLIKFVVTYSKAFWKEKGFSGKIISYGKESGSGPICSCYDITYKNRPALTGYISSHDCNTDEIYKEQVLQQLAKYFGDEALNPTDYYEKNWMKESYVNGCCMNSPGLGNMDKFHEIKQPSGRLFWAGTETATSWNGYMGGAVQAGYRAAIEVLYDYHPQSLQARDIHFINCNRRRSQHRIKDALVYYRNNWKIILIPITGILLALYLLRRLSAKNVA